MKGILVDENLPAELRLPTALPISHVTAGSNSPTDSSVWQEGREKRLVILTKDGDFRHRILISEPPPWIVHVRVGNLRLQPFIEHITSVWPSVEALLPKHKLISIFLDRIEAIE
jgi:predicted nuclease of predicted toxin-antitoxin system